MTDSPAAPTPTWAEVSKDLVFIDDAGREWPATPAATVPDESLKLSPIYARSAKEMDGLPAHQTWDATRRLWDQKFHAAKHQRMDHHVVALLEMAEKYGIDVSNGLLIHMEKGQDGSSIGIATTPTKGKKKKKEKGTGTGTRTPQFRMNPARWALIVGEGGTLKDGLTSNTGTPRGPNGGYVASLKRDGVQLTFELLLDQHEDGHVIFKLYTESDDGGSHPVIQWPPASGDENNIADPTSEVIEARPTVDMARECGYNTPKGGKAVALMFHLRSFVLAREAAAEAKAEAEAKAKAEAEGIAPKPADEPAPDADLSEMLDDL